MKKQFLFILGIFLLITSSFAQNSYFDNYVYQMWSSFGGLKGTTATDIIQTRDGFINISTYEGLVKFDGVEFNTFKKAKDNDLSFVSVRSSLEDSSGNLWLGSNDEGLQLISPEGNKNFTTENGLPNNSVRALAEDKLGNIWVGTAAGVVYLSPSKHIFTPQFEAGATAKGIIATALYCDTAGRIWLLTANEQGLYLFSDGIFKTIPELDSFGSYFATAIGQDLKNTFWIGLGDEGIITLKNGEVTKVTTGTLLDHNSTKSIYTAPNGAIWFGTEKGLAVYDDGSFYEYTGEMLNTATINKIIDDREGNIWIATDRNGVGKLTHGKFKMHKLGITVNTLTEDQDGIIWGGTDSGVVCFDKDCLQTNTLTEATKGLRIRDLYTTKNGDILVSCYSKPGLIRYSNGTFKNWTTDDGLAGNKVRVAIETRQNDIYVGTTTGLSIIHPDGSIRTFKQVDGLENEYIMALYQDTNNIVWIGTDGYGVYLMKDEKIVAHFNTNNGLIGNVIFKITQDLDGAYWICTGSGISRYPNFDSNEAMPTVIENINSDNGLGTDSVFQILADTANNLWFTSNHGIASATYNEVLNVARGTVDKLNVKFYNRNDGLDSDGPTSTAKSIIDKYGRIWFTMVDGVAVYDPLKVVQNPVMPLVQIQSVTVDNTIYTNLNQTIILNPGTKRIEIKYTGISFDAPERIQFTHKLSGFEDNFSMISPARTVSYTNLSPGKHTFFVNAINGDGFYSEQAKAILFVQKPYIYQMPIFWIIIALFIIGALLSFFYAKQRRMRLENIRLERMVQQRTFELKKEKDKSDMLIRAILPEKIAGELKDEIRAIGEDFDDVTILFSDIVEFTKTSSGRKAGEIVNALNDLFCRFDERAKKCGVEKIKTIGDAYMAACGIPSPNEKHADIMIDFAKGMMADLEEYNKTADIKFKIRIGLNCGPATAGVIGKTKFIYDVWGNTVNVASRMESAANPGKIRVSQSVYDHVKDNGVQFTEPIECNVKGKGLMTTYEII